MSLVLTPLQSLAGELGWCSSLLGVAEESRRLKMYVPGSFYFYCFIYFHAELSYLDYFGELCSSYFILWIMFWAPALELLLLPFQTLCSAFCVSYFKYGLDAFKYVNSDV